VDLTGIPGFGGSLSFEVDTTKGSEGFFVWGWMGFKEAVEVPINTSLDSTLTLAIQFLEGIEIRAREREQEIY